MGEDDRREAPPLRFGDYPHGRYVTASSADTEGLPEASGPPPWVTRTPRSSANPYPIRMFTEEGGIALWVPLDEPLPGWRLR